MSMKKQVLLVPVDGSEHSLRAVERAIEMHKAGQVKDVHLLNVQLPIPTAVTTFVGKKATSGFHYDEGMKAVAQAVAKLKRAHVAHEVHIGVGQPAETITEFCKELGCEAIVMGTHGHGKAFTALLGSTSRDVTTMAGVPVTTVK
jgi:nucleotide-binding universal stress UspA family protein